MRRSNSCNRRTRSSAVGRRQADQSTVAADTEEDTTQTASTDWRTGLTRTPPEGPFGATGPLATVAEAAAPGSAGAAAAAGQSAARVQAYYDVQGKASSPQPSRLWPQFRWRSRARKESRPVRTREDSAGGPGAEGGGRMVCPHCLRRYARRRSLLLQGVGEAPSRGPGRQAQRPRP